MLWRAVGTLVAMTVLGRDAMLVPLHAALRDAKGGEVELWAHRRRSAITRYAKDQVHQNALADETFVQARVAVKNAVGVASANSLEPADLRRLIADARAAAELSVPNADWPGLAAPSAIDEPRSFDAATADVDASAQAGPIRQIADAARAKGMRAAGTHQVELVEEAVANTNGLGAYAPMTWAYLRALVLTDRGGSGWGEDLAQRTVALDAANVADRAIAKAARDHDRVQLEPGDYEAVFEELAIAEVLRFVSLTGLTGQTLKDGRSFMAGSADPADKSGFGKTRFGEQVTGPKLSLWEDALDPRTLAIPFDPEGTPKQRVTFVEGGVARGVVHDRQAAKWFGTKSTGHAADGRRYAARGHAGHLPTAGRDADPAQPLASV